MTHKIQANQSGTRFIEVSDDHLQTLQKYQLLNHLVDSNGVVDESVVDKLKLNIRSMLETEYGSDKNLLDLCLDVVYDKNMKAFGLQGLIALYNQWEADNKATEATPDDDNTANEE